MNPNRLSILMLFSAAIFWSTSGVLIKLVALHPMAIAGWRSLIAGGVILLLCRKEVKISWGLHPLLAAGCMGLFCICFVVATKLTTAANAIVLQYSASTYVAILAPRMLGEPTRRQDWYFLSLVVAGICLFFMDDISTRGTLGILVGMVGSIFWAGAMIFLRKSRGGSTAWPIALGNFMAAGLCLPFMFRQAPSSMDWLGLAGLGIISLGAGYAVFSYAIKRVRALEAVLIPSIEPLINPMWVFLATGEAPGMWAFIGGTLVLAAVTVRGISTAYNGRIKIPPAKQTALTCAME
ncbi:MAG: EamA family transporter [Desulfosarcina sp.]|nr:EamA family transporter [Desulfosarcina sp.]MBC2745270.1 EamA family transporter [Desulfosarcina sp.]MBC2768177.1 EamA family transporter [Desulfosarcina sp.]